MAKYQVPYSFSGNGCFHIEAATEADAIAIANHMPVNNKFQAEDFGIDDTCVVEIKTDADLAYWQWSDEDAEELKDAIAQATAIGEMSVTDG